MAVKAQGNATAKPAAAPSSLFQAALADAKKTVPSLPTTSDATPSTTTQPSPSAPSQTTPIPFLHPTARDPTKIPIFTTGFHPGGWKKWTPMARVLVGLPLKEAKTQMEMHPRKPGRWIAHTINRMQHTLRHNYGEDPDNYKIAAAWTGRGQQTKELDYKAKGRFGIIHHRTSHIRIQVAKIEHLTEEEKGVRKVLEVYRAKPWLREWKENERTMRDGVWPRHNHQPWSRQPWVFLDGKKWADDSYLKIKRGV
ncbi:54S ribosomal protein L22, mitochondrial [Rhizophlyctis rosea]|nr:54S ribosomal protein L22, mitochondrial [Rhizophlyctis rosea]